VLRCATCGKPLSVGAYFAHATHERIATYGCTQPDAACPRPARINATAVEDAVVDEVKRLLANESESASMDNQVAEAEDELAHAESALDAAVTAFDGIGAASVNAKLKVLQEAVDSAAQRVRQLRAATAPALTVNATADWQSL